MDIRFGFMLRNTSPNKKGQFPIIFRITFRNERRDLFTALYCSKKDWNASAGKFDRKSKMAVEGNRNLEMLHRKAANAFDQLRFNGDVFSLEELIDKIKGKEERPQLLIDYLREGAEKVKLRAGVDVTKATYEKYRRSVLHTEEFLMKEFKVRNYSINRLNTHFLEKYFRYLRTTRNLQHNTAVKHLSFVKTVLLPAIRAGVIKNDPFRELKLRLKPVYPGFLNQEEIDKLVALELKDRNMARKRDIFLFACYTGLAYVDLKGLKGEHIFQEKDGSYYIIKARQKTGEQSIIPLLPASARILQSYSPTGDIRDFMWYVSSNQKMNEGIKILGQMAGIEKPLHMHLARHTFATTVTLSNGVPIESVSKMLGHATIKQTQHYAKVVASKIKDDMSKIMGLYQ
ncbi:site-specific integrase [Phnomibacter sp.]|uniref:site-specific integrase n=1 Tax=Phnomibacter sp. TaxID=2836217 RepID=UPI002FDF0120